jgi:hypothetical protein
VVANHPEDPAAAALTTAINRNEGAALINHTRTALAAGQLTEAANDLRSARALLGNASEIIALEKDLAAREQRLQNLLASARREAAAGNADAARTALETAATEAPGMPQIAEASAEVQAELTRINQARAAREQTLAEGRAALAKLDFAAADAAFAKVLTSDPRHPGALEGRAQSAAKRQEISTLVAKIDASIASRELAAATHDLTLLSTAAPGLPATTRAKTQVEELKALLADETRQAAELEAHRTSLAKALLACLLYTSPSPRDH